MNNGFADRCLNHLATSPLLESNFYTIEEKFDKEKLTMGQDIDSLVRENKEKLTELEHLIGYRFTDLRLLQRALIHSSFAFEQTVYGKDNERLEFLGDAVLDLVVGHLLMRAFGEFREGDLSRLRASLVNEQNLAALARDVGLGDFLELGKGEDATHGRQKPRILSCAWEAVTGAIFIDGGYESVAEVMKTFFQPDLKNKKEELLVADAKSRLQEILQEKHGDAPTYTVENERGPAHARVFTVSVHFQGKVLGEGCASSKKEAEQRAAADALTKNSWLC